MPTPSIARIRGIALVVSVLADAETFFAEAFDAVVVDRGRVGKATAALLGCPGATIERTVLRLGEGTVELLAFDPPGRPYPRGGTSTDLAFQHFAMIVSDMDAAYARLRAVGRFTPISVDGPVTLPPSSGSVSAFKFRDADGHPLELLAFPPGEAPPAWRDVDGLVLGIDHSAISVADTARSAAFFEGAFGLTLGSRTENRGVEQARMDAVPEASVTVSGLMPRHAPPHLELLGYHVGSRRPIDPATTSADVAATHVILETADLASVVEALTVLRAPFISPGIVTLEDGTLAVTVLDPDGHRFVVTQPA